jgi:cobyrinic acid a,c-diamide synthase
MANWFEWVGLLTKGFCSGIMTLCRLIVFHGGFAQAVQVLATQNTLTGKTQKLNMQIWRYSTEVAALTVFSAKIGNTETYLQSLVRL